MPKLWRKIMIETKKITPEMCECGRLYKDCIDKDGKTICSACHLGCDVETLKKIWSTQSSHCLENLKKRFSPLSIPRHRKQ